MSQTVKPSLDGVAETLLATLYIRALESQRPDGLMKDEKAVEFVQEMGPAFEHIKQIRMDEDDKVTIILRNREFDFLAREFLASHTEAVVVHIGCGLDARFERVDNGHVEWYDLDLPQVIELRRMFIGGESGRYHLLGCSVFDSPWREAVSRHRPRPFLFLAEGVFMYFEPDQVRSLVLSLQAQFPGAELVFDAFSPFLVRANNLRMSLTKMGARYHWGLKRGKELESWHPGIRLVGQWGYFDRPEPRLEHIRWMRHIPLLANVLHIYRYRLGNPAG
jgi:O-methyltransferase involved in polyketide biosynthesis